MKLRNLFIAALFTVLSSTGMSQNYSTAAGLRVGAFSGLTMKHFVSGTNAIEGLASMRWGGVALTGLFEWQKPIRGARNLDYFLGLGAHIGIWDNNKYYWYHEERNGSFVIFGVDFIAGLEYTFPGVPFNLGLDWKPAFNLTGDNHWWGDEVAVSIRYTF